MSGAAERVRVPCPILRPPPCPSPRVTSQGLSFQLRQGPVGLGPEGPDERRTPGAQSGRLIEMERSVSVNCCTEGPGRGGACDLAPADPPHPPLPGRMQLWWPRRWLCRGSCSSWRGSWAACRAGPRSSCCRVSGRRSTAAACRWVVAPQPSPLPCLGPTHPCRLPPFCCSLPLSLMEFPAGCPYPLSSYRIPTL